MDDKQKLAEITSVLQGIATIMKDAGKTDTEINQIMFQLITKVEMAVVDELIETLPPEKQKLLDDMSAQNKSMKEIGEVLQLDPVRINEIEMRKFQDVINMFLDTLPPKN